MPLYDREEKIIGLLSETESMPLDILASKLFISLPTLRRDLIKLENRGLVTRMHGKVSIKRAPADTKIPFFLRIDEQSDAKLAIAKEAVKHIKDSSTIMLDASTSAYCIIPHLKNFKDIIVITSGARAALLLAHLGIKNICTGGNMLNSSFSYVGRDALEMLSHYNADIAFFSCRGLSDDGIPSDSSAEENDVRRVMMARSKKNILLCDKSKFGKVYLNNLCPKEKIDVIISDDDL